MSERVIEGVRDGAAVVGGLLVAYGFGLAWRPLGFIVGGGLLLAAGIVGALRARPVQRGGEVE